MRKRKLHSQNPNPKSSKTKNPKTITDPYPDHIRPTDEECLAVRDDLLSLHGFPEEFIKYRRNRVKSEPSDEGFCSTETTFLDTRGESVLDGLVSTLLSQNTTETNSRRAFESLKSVFPTWEDVLAAESKCVEDAIKCGGLAVTKASCIKNILSSLLENRGKICLEYLRGMPVDEIKAELCRFKGIGPKTVFRIAKSIGWVPVGADREKTYLHLNRRIPNELKFDLNCLLVTHGKLCKSCTSKGGNHHRNSCNGPCPLTNYSSSIE
ncbi:DNA glycosylase superfamily protein isoform X1 [Tasmannia lanceolata]|uniref:DNA glycosylase superfamily protein isoform X1 n=1 Tax=Tasmannia lanceolata TaxID=3420 RepID=UPI004064742F